MSLLCFFLSRDTKRIEGLVSLKGGSEALGLGPCLTQFFDLRGRCLYKVKMRIIKSVGWSLVLLALLVTGGYVLVNYYSFIFAKTIVGEVVRVERVTEVSTMINVEKLDPTQLYSFAVAIRDQKGEIWTASGVDRQWAVVQPQQCVEAQIYPYPPWNLEKSGTYSNARLLRLFDCEKAPK